MKRLTALALAAATVISATAIAGTLAHNGAETQHGTRGARYERGPDEAYVPSVNNPLASQASGAFVLR